MSIRLRFLLMAIRLHQHRRTIQSGYGMYRRGVLCFGPSKDIQNMFAPLHFLQMEGELSLVLMIKLSEFGMPQVEHPPSGPSWGIRRVSCRLHSLQMEN